MKITDSNVSEITEKLKSERKSLVKQQILMYKTAVYRLVNGGITHQKQKIFEKGDIARQYIDTIGDVLLRHHLFRIFAVFDV